MNEEPIEISDWLRRLAWALDSVPPPERDDIVSEAQAHLLDSVAAGKSAAAALAGFGAPDDYARRFVDDRDVVRALGSGRAGSMLSVVAGRAHRSLVAAVAGIVLLVLGAAVFTAVTMSVFKLADPAHAGLWRGAHEFFIGNIDDPREARELLGGWLYVLALATVALSWIAGRFTLVWALRRLSHKR